MTPQSPSDHVPWALDCCLACFDALDGEGLYPIFCATCESLTCPHATNHNNPCQSRHLFRAHKPTPPIPRQQRFTAGKLLRDLMARVK